jgi:diguanylate cyclase (GGDEF)-like protein
MPTQEAVLVVILVAIVANLVLAIGLLVAPRFRSGARRPDRDESADINRHMLIRARQHGDDPWGRPAPAQSDRGSAVVASSAAEAVPEEAPAEMADDVADDAAAAEAVPVDDRPADTDSTDLSTGFDGPATWAKRLTEENARVQRYGRAATIVLVELAGVDRLAERLGPDAAERLIPPIATTMRRHARSSDSLARLGPTRFAALLPDTDEVRAINYIERVRTACDVWLEAGAVSLRLSVGWAEISPNQPVDPAVAAAERRLNAERQRLRSREPREPDEGRDVMAAQMRQARAS